MFSGHQLEEQDDMSTDKLTITIDPLEEKLHSKTFFKGHSFVDNHFKEDHFYLYCK